MISEPKHFESLYPADSRFNEIQSVLGYIKQGNSCQVIALPGVGRSTVLGLLTYNKHVRVKHLGDDEPKVHFVLTNFSEVRKKPLIDVTKFLFLAFVDSLRERKLENEYHQAKTIFQEALSMNDELVLFHGLKQAVDLLVVQKQITVVFLFDRFEEYIPTLTADFFANMRVLRNRAKYKFSVVFSLTRPLEESIEPSLMTEYYDFVVGHTIYLPIMDEPGHTFRVQYAQQKAGKTLTPELISKVNGLCGDFMREVKVCIQVLLAEETTTFSTDASLVSALLSHRRVQRPLFELWQSLTPSEQKYIISISNGESNNVSFDFSYLTKVGLINNSHITIPLFSMFIQHYVKNMPAIQHNTIVFDEDTGTIKKGDQVISENLTSSEFRLLRYLLHNAERIIEREEIITAVWKETATTAGVTDQAVDQLIFRVRRKIEDDPNNPKHIQTVKGRGLKFSA